MPPRRAAIFVRLALGGLGDRWGRRRLSLATLLVYTVAVLAMVELAQIGLARIAALFGLAHGLFYPAYSAWRWRRHRRTIAARYSHCSSPGSTRG